MRGWLASLPAAYPFWAGSQDQSQIQAQINSLANTR